MNIRKNKEDKRMSGFDDLINEEQKQEGKKTGTGPPKDPIANHIAFVMDHSGSMSNLAEASRTNFNEQLAQIRKDSDEQENYVTIIEFDNKIKEVCRNKPIDIIKDLDDYWIGGMTALYDSVMQAIWGIETDMPKEGNHAALVVIITVGYEIASVENGGEKGRKRLKERITKLQETGKWTFVFMGADQDVLETAVDNMGIYAGNTMAFAATVDGTRKANAAYKMSFDNYTQSRSNSSSITSDDLSTKNFFEGDKKNDN